MVKLNLIVEGGVYTENVYAETANNAEALRESLHKFFTRLLARDDVEITIFMGKGYRNAVKQFIEAIEKGTPVIALATDEDLYEKTISNIKEVKARGAYVVLLISDDLDIASDYYDDVLVIPKVDKLIQGILTVIPLQLLAYEIARLRGCEIDQPRNLAKSVTVE